MSINFNYLGPLSASKSIFNRALVVQSFFPQLEILGSSQAQDVLQMKEALRLWQNGQPLFCGEAGSVLRFLALRVSRETNFCRLQGTPRLLARPQQDLIKILSQLGVSAQLGPAELTVQSWGWKVMGDGLYIPMNHSSQFASGVLLSAWDFPQPLFIHLGPHAVSPSYLNLTLQMLKGLGMKWEHDRHEIYVPPHQKINEFRWQVEPDMSSAFALAACAAVAGQLTLTGFPQQSLQPDFIFIKILQEMGVKIKQNKTSLEVVKSQELKPLDIDVGQTPDLFPSLAVLASLASGESYLLGALQLSFKESDRLKKTAELIQLSGRKVEVFQDGLKIYGEPGRKLTSPVVFDPDQDHRMAMAAAIYKGAGEPVHIQNPFVVNKSCPEFWNILGLGPVTK